MSSREERLVENELLFRQVNERIAELGEQQHGELEIVCECADERCTKAITLLTKAYERVREHPDRFIVFIGHQVASIEKVVETDERYFVVEKVAELLRRVEAPA